MLTDHFHYHTIYVQLPGFVALLFSVATFQVNRRKHMLVLNICSALIWSVHFLLLGAFTGSAMNLLTAGRNYAFYTAGKRRNYVIPLVVCLLFVAGALITWQGPRSLLPLTGSIIGTIAFWQVKTTRIRFIALLGPCCWFTYNALSGSYAGMATDLIVFMSILLGIIRSDANLTQDSKRRSLKPRKPALAAASAKR